jgi:hypothetical protein
MSLLDLQTLETPADTRNHEGGESEVSLLLCDSAASVTLCL